MALDEATAGFLAAAAEQGGPALHEMTPEQMREMNGGLTPLFGEGPEVGSVETISIPTSDHESFPARVFKPKGETDTIIVYYHGGGWVIGDLDGFDTLCRQITDRTGATTVLIEYRKAPEYRYPTAAEDAWTALQWAVANQADLASENAQLIVAGDSAGGNLSAIVAQRAVKEGGPQIALQGLIYPVTDADFTNESYNDPANALMLSKESMVLFWDLYAPDEMERANPDASPLQGDPTGTAPALVLVAEHDVLRNEGEAYANKLRDSGVPTEEHLVEGQMHGFFTFPNVLPGAATGMDLFVAAVKKATAKQTA